MTIPSLFDFLGLLVAASLLSLGTYCFITMMKAVFPNVGPKPHISIPTNNQILWAQFEVLNPRYIDLQGPPGVRYFEAYSKHLPFILSFRILADEIEWSTGNTSWSPRPLPDTLMNQFFKDKT